MISRKSPEIKQAAEQISKAELRRWGRWHRKESLEMARRDEMAYRDDAIEEGKLENRIETAKNAVSLGLPFDTITKLTGFTEEEIKALE